MSPKHLALRGLTILSLLFVAACQTAALPPPPSYEQMPDTAALYVSTIDKNMPIAELTRLADGGDAHAQNDLGAHYAMGDTVKRDLDKSFHYHLLAANQNLAVAQVNVGYMYYAGESVSRDLGKAAEWMYKAAAQGHFEGQFALGRMYATGEGLSKDEDLAERWWLLSAGQGHLDSQRALKHLYETGSKKNPEKAALWALRVSSAQRNGHTWKKTDTVSTAIDKAAK